MAAPDLGTRSKFKFGGSALDGTSSFPLTGISVSGISKESIPTSHLLTDVANTFLPSQRYDGGEVTVSAQLDHAQWVLLMADIYGTGSTAPTEGSGSGIGEVDIVLGGEAAEIMRFDAFVVGSDFDIPDEGLMTCEITFKVTGNIEWVAV